MAATDGVVSSPPIVYVTEACASICPPNFGNTILDLDATSNDTQYREGERYKVTQQQDATIIDGLTGLIMVSGAGRLDMQK